MSVAGFTPVMQSTAQDVKVHERTVDSHQRVTKSMEQKESESTAGDRDADGRQAWQWNQQQRKQQSEPGKKVPDISGKVGATLDLDG